MERNVKTGVAVKAYVIMNLVNADAFMDSMVSTVSIFHPIFVMMAKCRVSRLGNGSKWVRAKQEIFVWVGLTPKHFFFKKLY